MTMADQGVSASALCHVGPNPSLPCGEGAAAHRGALAAPLASTHPLHVHPVPTPTRHHQKCLQTLSKNPPVEHHRYRKENENTAIIVTFYHLFSASTGVLTNTILGQFAKITF